ncbi:MAG TPA: RNA polymerase sigma factor [Candidatus Avipropionibacterium avicola]|uniref:RNA polymerase sigma factor n=1 Tax=Candidatus Avipropionibacterium avicola TaxID=2840701 RepID=A0A9D1H078_9ACTN|nr:RNA polymerase sigma factor [Candidatus Avipropionibacterium avicola]
MPHDTTAEPVAVPIVLAEFRRARDSPTPTRGPVPTGGSPMTARSSGGSSNQVEAAFQEHLDAIYNYCYRRTSSWSVAEDLVATVFLEAWRSRDRARIVDDSLLPWLYGIASNVCRHHQRSFVRGSRAVRRLRATPEDGPRDPSDEPSPVEDTTPAVTALTKADIAEQQEICLAESESPDGDWEIVYAQRIPVIGSDETRDVLLLDDGQAHLTCVDGDWAGWSLSGEAGKNVPRTPSDKTPAVVSDGVFTGTSSVDDDAQVQFGLRVTDEVVAGQVRTIGPDGTSGWSTVEARQGWLLAEVSVRLGTTVEFRAIDADGDVVNIADVDGTAVTKLVERTEPARAQSTGR